MIPYGRQSISEVDIERVSEVLRSDFLTQGSLVPQFERRIAGLAGAAHAVAVNSATSALHLACVALNVGPGDIVWTSPITFVASANCALYCGAEIDFVDIDPATANMCTRRLGAKLEDAGRSGRLPKVVIPIHFAGEPADMKEVNRLSRKYGFSVIEDASHAIGGQYEGKSIGDCSNSDITVFSFHAVKTVTSGEGGVAVTQHSDLADRMKLCRSHGVTRDPEMMTKTPEGPWYYQQVSLGFNYRMTDIHAALGLSQIDRLEYFIARRHELAARYDQLLSDLPVNPLLRNAANYSGLHLYVIRLDLSQLKKSHKLVFECMRNAGIGVNLHYIPVHMQPYYCELGFSPGDFPESEKYYGEAITLPLFPDLTYEQQDKIVNSLGQCLV